MNKSWFFVGLLLVQFAVQSSWRSIDRNSPIQWNWKTWFFVTTCWMLAIFVSSYNSRPFHDCEQASNEETCRIVMSVINPDVANLELWSVASGVYYQTPNNAKGKSQKELRKYVHSVAQSWDDCKELQRKG